MLVSTCIIEVCYMKRVTLPLLPLSVVLYIYTMYYTGEEEKELKSIS